MRLEAKVALLLRRAEELSRAGSWKGVKDTLVPHRADLAQEPRTLFLLAHAQVKLHEYKPAREAAAQALSGFEAAEDCLRQLEARNLLGIIAFETGDLEEARVRFSAALKLAVDLDESLMQARLHNNLGTLHSLQGNAAAAIPSYQQALEIFRQMSNPLGEAQALHNLGLTHRDLGLSEEAERCFSEAAACAQAAGEQRLYAMAVVAHAEMALQNGNLDEAESKAKTALDRFDKESSLFGMAEVNKILGMIARSRGDQARARAHFDMAVSVSFAHSGPLLDAEVRIERALLLREMGMEPMALKDLETAASTFERLGAQAQAERARSLLIPQAA